MNPLTNIESDNELKGKNEVLFLFIFFSPLLGFSAYWYIFFFIYIVYSFLWLRRGVSVWGISFAFVFITFLFIKFEHFSNFSIWFGTVKFYMGWAIITLFLYLTRLSVNINKLIILLSCEIIIEFILINTIVPTSILPNYPETDGIIMTGSFARVYSVGCNATITATILVILLAYRESIRKKSTYFNKHFNKIISILSLIAIILLGSATGFILYILYISYKLNLLKIKYIFFFCLFIYVIVLGLQNLKVDEDSIFQRLSFEYFQYILEFKEWQLTELIYEYNVVDKFLGSDLKHEGNPVIWGDIALLEYYISLGICGLSLFLLYVFKFINKYNYFPILIGIIGAVHYGGIFSFSGQLIFAYSLLLNKSSIDFYGYNKISVNTL